MAIWDNKGDIGKLRIGRTGHEPLHQKHLVEVRAMEARNEDGAGLVTGRERHRHSEMEETMIDSYQSRYHRPRAEGDAIDAPIGTLSPLPFPSCRRPLIGTQAK